MVASRALAVEHEHVKTLLRNIGARLSLTAAVLAVSAAVSGALPFTSGVQGEKANAGREVLQRRGRAAQRCRSGQVVS